MTQLADLISLFTGYSMWDYITVLFDNIVKVVYLIYTAVASCLDLLQCVMRKLAGLDSYWININGDLTEVAQQDPILEFIYGMLGIGRNAGTYSALSTVFWSLAIFGIIVLVISTIVAIIKSHYGEDSNKTNPLSYVYTAVKAIFTFAIVPVAVILGVYLSQFMLKTLDDITAGRATEETIRGIYGDQALQNLKADENGNYSYYDFFGFGPTSSSQTISGLMFKCASYSANRVRRGDYNKTGGGNGGRDFAHFGVIGNTNVPSKPSNTSDADWLAYQIDYAFQNNLHLNRWFSDNELYDNNVSGVLITIASVDFFRVAGFGNSFSKYNVGLVWYYYYLWNFNFFVGFASIIVSFGLLTSIIIGLMARLIQSAALFLIYPAVLGLAPLDEFGAFKKWRGEFMGYVLMAFGSIIGMNIFFLILPYINEFNWFGWNPYVDLPSMIINSLIIIVGLLGVKSFIAFISGLIGGKDASTEGNGMKKDLGETVGKAARMTAGAAHIGMALNPANRLIKTGINVGIGKAKDKWQQHVINREEVQTGFLTADERTQNMADAGNNMENIRNRYETGTGTNQTAYDNAFRRFHAQMTSRGVDMNSAEYEAEYRDFQTNFLETQDADYQINKQMIDREGYATQEHYEHHQAAQEATQRQKVIRQQYYMDPDTGSTHGGRNLFRADFLNAGREMGGAFLKFVQEGMKDLNIDLKGMQGVFQMMDNNKYDKDGKYAGSYVTPVDQRAAGSYGGFNRQLGHDLTAPFRALGSVFTGRPGPGTPPGVVAPSDEKRTADTLAKMEQTNRALLKAVEKLNRARP